MLPAKVPPMLPGISLRLENSNSHKNTQDFDLPQKRGLKIFGLQINTTNLEEKMILLGENTDGLIASELMKPSREQITVFCGAEKGNGNPFPENGTGAVFQDFSKSTTSDPTAENYKIERKGCLKDTGK